MLTRPTRCAVVLAAAAALLAGATGCSGCGRSSEPVVTPLPKAVQDLGSIAQAYREAFEQRGKAPESFDDLRQYLTSLGGSPDEMRVSPNDGQPYVVMWGADPTRGGPGPVKGMWSIVAHEQTGANGVRAVADARGLAITVTDEEFAKLTFIRKRKSGKSGEK
jgi:hypothetical protein